MDKELATQIFNTGRAFELINCIELLFDNFYTDNLDSPEEYRELFEEITVLFTRTRDFLRP